VWLCLVSQIPPPPVRWSQSKCITDNFTSSSDFASATEAGYQSAFVIEAPFEKTSPYIHTDGDTLSTVNYNHMKQHGQMTLGFVYELAFTAF
jgi:Zn-dependent M28 family amino/carboxypeptidase